MRQHLPEALFINLLQSEFYVPLLANPGHLRDLIPPRHQDWIVIDEIQRVPELLNEVHELIESKRYRFVLTGSSARKLRRKGVNLLAGRALTYHMHPLTAAEQGAAFQLVESLRYGNLPARFSEDDPARYLKDYVQTYLREEVLQEGLTRNIGHFTRFLEAASFSQGALINISAVARECQVERSVAENYFSILDDLLIAVRLPAFTKRAKRQLVTHAKFFYFDTGVFRSVRPAGPLDSPAEIDGPALETLVLQELRAVNDYGEHGFDLYFWRTKSGLEVDFILYGDKGLIAIEVKRTPRLDFADMRALREFKNDYPPTRCFVFYGGTTRQYFDDIVAVPLQEALKELDSILGGRLPDRALWDPDTVRASRTDRRSDRSRP